MKVIILLFSIFVGVQSTAYDTEAYSMQGKNKSLLLVDPSTNYEADDATDIYAISVLEDLFTDNIEIEYDFQDEGGNSLVKGKINSCNIDTSTPSGTAMKILLKSLGSKDFTCPLKQGDYKVDKESRIENVELGTDAMDMDTILLCLNIQQLLNVEIYLYKVI